MQSPRKTAIATIAVVTSMSLILVAGTIDLTNLFDYESQTVPNYIQQDNTTPGNDINNATATLGRVLFYDRNLSSDMTVSCSTCHQQEFGFSDLAVVSQGVNGVTGRHSMRLINSRFSDEERFFWDERADTLEEQVTQPIQDHGEMGFSGTNGDPDFNDLIERMEGTPYYKSLFTMAFGDSGITEARMQLALAQFIRSIQSFDSKFDAGLATTNGNPGPPFSNFTAQENMGKNLFRQPPQFQAPAMGQPPTGIRIGGGLGCAGCHRGPELAIDPQGGGGGPQRNNGVIGVAGDANAVDLTNSKSPTLRDMFSPDGVLNGPMMHDGSMGSIDDVLDHYNDITRNDAINPNLDGRLHGGPNGPGQKLMMTTAEREALIAFLKTTTGSDVYTNERWSDPFEADGTLTLVGNVTFDPVEINDNSAQRSNVESVTVRFDGDVDLLPGAITVAQRNTKTSEAKNTVAITVTEQSVGGQTVATVQFDDYTRNANGSLEDGNYQLNIAGHLVSRDGIPMGEDYSFGDEETEPFFTHYGDGNGDRSMRRDAEPQRTCNVLTIDLRDSDLARSLHAIGQISICTFACPLRFCGSASLRAAKSACRTALRSCCKDQYQQSIECHPSL